MKKLLVFFLLFLGAAQTTYALQATLSFDPIEIKTSQNETFQVNVNIFTENEPAASTDVVITYDSTLVRPLPNETKSGNLFQTVDSKIIAPGKLYLYGIQENKNDAQPARGTVATVQFKALKTGQMQLYFDCTSGKNTSQIIKFNSNFQNIIDCSATSTHSAKVTISDSSVLGAFTDSYTGFRKYTFLLGSIVIIFTCYIIVKYHRLHRDLS